MRGLATAILILLLAAPAAAQTAAARFVGKPVEQIETFIENTKNLDPAIDDLIQLRVGQQLTMEAVRESITHLYSIGRFQDVQVDATDGPGGGANIRFTLVPVHTVQRLEFSGDFVLDEGRLRRAVEERYGASPPVRRAEEVARTLRRVFEDEGYLSASIRAVPRELHDPDRTVLTFEIDAGPRALINNVQIQGNPLTPAPVLMKRLEATRGAPYRAARIQERLDEYRNDLRQRGFYRATASIRPQPAGGNIVDLFIDIDTGPLVTVRFEGDRLPQDRLNELVPIRREASIEEDLLEDAEARLENYLREQGYWKADVTVRQEQGDGTLAIVFTINRGLQFRIAGPLEIRGAQAVPLSGLKPLITGLEPGEIFRESELTQAGSKIEDYYRRRGHALVAVKSAPNEVPPVRPGEGLIQPVVVVNEGPLVVVGEVRISGNTAISEQQLRDAIKTKPGDPFYPPQSIADREAIVSKYLNLGFAEVIVEVQPGPSEEPTHMPVTFAIQEGPQTFVDHILIVGNQKTDPDVIRRELVLKEGGPLGFDAKFESHRRLAQLGLFRRIRIDELAHGGTNRHDVVVTVEEAPRTSYDYGGGVEAAQRLRATGPNGEAEERLEFGPRGFFNIGRRNVGGRNRTVNLFTRVSLKPRDAPDDPEQDGSGFGFSEYRVIGTYRQPNIFALTDFIATGAIEQGVRSSFNFTRKGVNAEIARRFLKGPQAIRVSGRYTFSTTRTFDERLDPEDQAQIDRAFPQVRLSGFAGAVSRDTRDDVLDPERGMLVSTEGSVFARALGGQVGFMKSYSQALWFRRMPGPRRIVFATRVAIGLADGFERETPATDDEGNPIDGPPVIVEDLPASERFFAGGDTTIRGYALDTVGAPDTISNEGFPTGGNAVVILNAELRVPVWGDLGTALFVDGGNVFRRVTQFDLGELRGAVGFGVRYNSPIGPVRLDLGFKLDRRFINDRLEPRTALHFSIGHIF